MKKLFFILLIISAHFTKATNYYISNAGNDANTGLSLVNAFLTIQKATDLVIAGDTVFVADGFYTGFNHLNKNNGTASQPIVYKSIGSNAVINLPKYNNNGINIENNNFIVIYGFNVRNMTKEGIRAVVADNIVIKNNNCDSCYRGIFTGYTDNIIVENNTCTNSHGEHGIYISNNSDNITLRYNKCSYNKRSGIQINPDLSSGAPGISVGVICTNNEIFENKLGAGLNFQGIENALIANNLIYNNHSASGLTLFLGDAATGCKNVKVYNNTFLVPVDGRWGIHIIDFADNINIYNNIIINLHPTKGAIALEPNTFSQTGIISNNNLVSNVFCNVDDACSLTLAQWQALGYDANSILAPSTLSTLFANSSTADFHLVANALAIDNGNSIVSTDITNDFELNTRPNGTNFDIGAYEFLQVNGVNNLNRRYKYIIYPNPLKEEIFIKTNFTISSVEIYSLQGALVYTSNEVINNKIANLNLQNGIYMMILKTKNGIFSRTKIEVFN